MKKYFLLLGLIFSMTFLCNAQNATIDFDLSYGNSYAEFTGTAADTFGIADSTYTFTVQKRTLGNLQPYVYLNLDSVGGTSNSVVITLSSKVFEEESYTLRESITWTTGADTAFSFESDTAHHSQIWQLGLTGQDNTFKIGVDNFNIHFVEEDN